MAVAVRGARAKPARASARSPRRTRNPAPAVKLRAGKVGGLSPTVAGYAACAVAVLGLALFLFTGDRLTMVGENVGRGIARQFAPLGFKVSQLHLQGATPAARGEILAAAAVYRDEPILSVDLPAMRERIKAVGWVQEARIVRLLPDTLIIHVDQRPPVAIWQHNGLVRVIDSQGRVIASADPARFPDLPFLVGEGAGEAAGFERDSGILSLIAERPRLSERLEALVRVDGRRWDLRLKDGGIVQLPAVGEDSALIQLDRLDQGQRLLELGFERIDLRTPEMVVVRRRETAQPGQLLAGGV